MRKKEPKNKEEAQNESNFKTRYQVHVEGYLTNYLSVTGELFLRLYAAPRVWEKGAISGGGSRNRKNIPRRG